MLVCRMLVWSLAAVTLTAPFGEASASAAPGPADGMTVGVSVVVESGVTAVVARVVFAGGSETAVALAPDGAGAWAGSLQTPRRENARVAFEAIGADGSARSSAPATLTALGADPAVVSPQAPPPPPIEPAARFPWGWLGLATGAAALGVLALWAAPGRGLDKLSGIPDDTANVE